MADLSLAKECDIKFTAEQVWADSQNQTSQYTADAETVKALAEQQAGRTEILTQLQNSNLDDDEVTIVWIDTCDTALDEDCQDVCNFTATDTGLKSKDYSLTDCVSSSFSVDENNLRRSMYSLEEVIAKQILAHTKKLDEDLNRKSLLFLSASAGLNKAPSAGTFAGTTTTVPAVGYNNELYLSMVIDAKRNGIVDPFVVDIGSLYRDYLRDMQNQGNAEGKGNAVRTSLFPTYFDLVGFATAPVSDDTFLISPTAYAFASRTYNDAAPTIIETKNLRQIRYTIASNTIPGVVYDVYKQIACVGKRFRHEYYIESRHGFFLNPVSCDVETVAAVPGSPGCGLIKD